MKPRKAVEFYNPDGSERWVGDCPHWIALTRRIRRDLHERTVIVYGPGPWPCHSC
ncbi:hypothetical protein [Nonomuraea sp. NPDC049646]|uniref:hypothetical protein n=1 Tax=unclassified Nonomuraea TaxID=2593643 RepID=UPI0037A3693A